MADNIYEGSVTEILATQEPEQETIIKKLPAGALYPVFNPGKALNIKFQGNVQKFPHGETIVPIKFAIFLISRFAPNEYDRPENNPRVLLDGKTVELEKPVNLEAEAKNSKK